MRDCWRREGDLFFPPLKALAEVSLNSRYLGNHEGGETPFVLDAFLRLA
jgi:hypothetical protein